MITHAWIRSEFWNKRSLKWYYPCTSVVYIWCFFWLIKSLIVLHSHKVGWTIKYKVTTIFPKPAREYETEPLRWTSIWCAVIILQFLSLNSNDSVEMINVVLHYDWLIAYLFYFPCGKTKIEGKALHDFVYLMLARMFLFDERSCVMPSFESRF